MFVYQGTAEQGAMYFGTLFADASAIADPDGSLYRAFGVERGNWRAMFGIRSWRSGIRATLDGHFINRKIGDAWTLPTIFAIRSGAIIGEFRGRYAGDHPDLTSLPRELGIR
ncbi:MAG: hypothetical protein ACE37B_07590 [Ilumatobacter sp.]|uniref:hypothetical protein n=1 Tax=Ilumatobacter sp. TaxID=1967498 RepID=UPI00391BBFA5